VSGNDRVLVAAGFVCAIVLVLLGYENGHWLFGLMVMATGFTSIWLTPWLWLRFIAYGFSIAPADPEEAAAFHSAARLVLRIGIPVWLAEIAYLSVPSDWIRIDIGWLLAVAQFATPITAAWLGFRAKATRKYVERDAGAIAPAQADPSSSRTPSP
jgi:hypothetical protein